MLETIIWYLGNVETDKKTHDTMKRPRYLLPWTFTTFQVMGPAKPLDV